LVRTPQEFRYPDFRGRPSRRSRIASEISFACRATAGPYSAHDRDLLGEVLDHPREEPTRQFLARILRPS